MRRRHGLWLPTASTADSTGIFAVRHRHTELRLKISDAFPHPLPRGRTPARFHCLRTSHEARATAALPHSVERRWWLDALAARHYDSGSSDDMGAEGSET